MPSAGYAHVIEALNLPVPPPRRRAEVSRAANRRVELDDRLLLPVRAAPKNGSVLEHLLFALRHEGVNLAVLAEALPYVPGGELQRRLDEGPLSAPLRRAAFLWEHFNQKKLAHRPPVKTWIPLFDPDQYITGPGRPSKRWKINVNGIGGLDYCPTVERSAAVKEHLEGDLLGRVVRWFAALETAKKDRVREWAKISEARGTYALERETSSTERTARFAELLGRIGKDVALSEAGLCALQNQLVLSTMNHAQAWRTEQNRLCRVNGRGALSVTYVPPRPEDLNGLMEGFLAMVNGWDDAVDPVVRAAVASFGFVYLHPFMDGNGRVSRLLLQRELARSRRLEAGDLLPVSAAMKTKEEDYYGALIAFSAPARRFWVVAGEGDEAPVFTFKGSANLYRYWDATEQVEFLFRMAEETIVVHLQEEAAYLKRFDEVCRRVEERFDLRQSHLLTLVGSAVDHRGALSNSIRRQFADKVEPEAMDFIEEAARRVLARQTDDLQSPVD